MQLLCELQGPAGTESANPAERQRALAQWVAKKITNVEVLALFASLEPLRPVQRQEVVGNAAARYGVAPCPFAASMSPALEIPEITTGGVLEMEPDTWVILVTPNGILVEGQAVVAVTNGNVDPDQLEGGALGMLIPRLTRYFQAMQEAGGGSRVALMITPSLSYGLLMKVLYSAKQAKIDRVQLLVRKNGIVKQIPMRLAGARAPDALGTPETAAESIPLQLVISSERNTLAVWSISGLEGTRASPKWTLPIDDRLDLTPLVGALEEIIQRRNLAAGGQRELVAWFDPATPMQTVAAVLAAARATDAKELFPHLLLSAGVE